MASKKWNQVTLAKHANLDQSSISKVLRGTKPSKRILTGLSKAFGLSIESLVKDVAADPGMFKVGFLFGLPTLAVANLFLRSTSDTVNLTAFRQDDKAYFEKDAEADEQSEESNTSSHQLKPIDHANERNNDGQAILVRQQLEPIDYPNEPSGYGRYKGFLHPKFSLYDNLDTVLFHSVSDLERMLLNHELDFFVAPETPYRKSRGLVPILTIAQPIKQEVQIVLIRKKDPNAPATNWWLPVFPSTPPTARPKQKDCVLMYEADTLSNRIFQDTLDILHWQDRVALDRIPLGSRQDLLSAIGKHLDAFSSQGSGSGNSNLLYLLVSDHKVSWIQSYVSSRSPINGIHYEVCFDSVSSLYPDDDPMRCDYKLFVSEDRVDDEALLEKISKFEAELQQSNISINERLHTVDRATRASYMNELAFCYDCDVLLFARMARNYRYMISRESNK
jgi:transcriptional regulator with XRE-family HTH domain